MRSSCVHRTNSTRGEGINARIGANIRHTFISTEADLFVMAIIPQRVAILRRMLRDEEERHDAILALLIRERQRQRRQQRRWWVKALDRATSPKMKVTFHQPIWIVLLDE